MYLYTKRNRTGLQKLCAHCGSHMNLLKKKEDRDVYQCTSCKQFHEIIHPIKEASDARMIGKKQRQGGDPVIIRDRSGEYEKKKQEQRQQLDNEQVENKDVTTDNPLITKVDFVKKGMDERKLIKFKYEDKNGNKTTRVVEPYKIEKDGNGNLVLWAYCTDKEGMRRFTLRNVKDLSVSEYEFKPKWEIEFKLKK